MWNLTGDDIQRAKEEMKGRRDAIKAHYDDEMKKLEADIAAIETFERAAVNFVSNFKVEEEPAATIADPEPAAEKVAADSVSERSSAARGEPPDRSERRGGTRAATRSRARSGTRAGGPREKLLALAHASQRHRRLTLNRRQAGFRSAERNALGRVALTPSA